MTASVCGWAAAKPPVANRPVARVALERVAGDPERENPQDNHVDLVVETPAGVALDRWDTETQVLDRLLLAGIAPGPRDLSLAAGRDGLYIAARGLGEPIWRIDWQRLEDAKWTAVPEVVARSPPADFARAAPGR